MYIHNYYNFSFENFEFGPVNIYIFYHKIFFIYTKQNQFTTKVINVGANKIPPSEFIKNLGITMDRVLSMEKDISNTCRAANMQN